MSDYTPCITTYIRVNAKKFYLVYNLIRAKSLMHGHKFLLPVQKKKKNISPSSLLVIIRIFRLLLPCSTASSAVVFIACSLSGNVVAMVAMGIPLGFCSTSGDIVPDFYSSSYSTLVAQHASPLLFLAFLFSFPLVFWEFYATLKRCSFVS